MWMWNEETKKNWKKLKADVRWFLQNQFGDEELAMLLAHAQSGRLRFSSCCCLIGMATIKQSTHVPGAYSGPSLEMGKRGQIEWHREYSHYRDAKKLRRADEAEDAFFRLVRLKTGCAPDDADASRRRILIPMIRAEMWRRDALKGQGRKEMKELINV